MNRIWGGIDRDTGFERNKFPIIGTDWQIGVPSARNSSLIGAEYRAGQRSNKREKLAQIGNASMTNGLSHASKMEDSTGVQENSSPLLIYCANHQFCNHLCKCTFPLSNVHTKRWNRTDSKLGR